MIIFDLILLIFAIGLFSIFIFCFTVAKTIKDAVKHLWYYRCRGMTLYEFTTIPGAGTPTTWTLWLPDDDDARGITSDICYAVFPTRRKIEIIVYGSAS